MNLHNTIIYLIGIPAVGKYTVAKEIGRIVFTNVLDARVPGDKAWFRRIERLAKQRKARFFPIWLTCKAEMIRQRKDTPERRAWRKDSDLTTIAWYLQEFEALRMPHPFSLISE